MVRDMDVKPAWLEKLMREKFFGGCGVHQNLRKNVFCLHCCLSLCLNCLSSESHRSHPFVQVRRYVYQDVVQLADLEKLVDCSNIKPYTINTAKVIFLKRRPQQEPRSCKGTANACYTCDKSLQKPYQFCSLSCKVDHMVNEDEGLSCIFRRSHESDFSFSQSEGLRVDNDDSEVIDKDTQVALSCSNTENTSSSVISCEAATADNKKTNVSRRKSAPRRAPPS